MLRDYTPHDWFWVVGDDLSRAWSSAAGAYVSEWDQERTTRIDTEQNLSDVLRPYGLRAPTASINDVRAEAQRRIIALVGATDLQSCLIKQLNANMRANELNDIQHSRELTPEETAEANALRGLATRIKSIRAASNVLEPNPPADYADNKYWPA
jgi:hypothetical protein